MNMRDLIPWGRNQQTTQSRYREEGDRDQSFHVSPVSDQTTAFRMLSKPECIRRWSFDAGGRMTN